MEGLMVYKSNEEFCDIVKAALVKEKVNQELIKKIVKLVQEMHTSGSPVFNALEFANVDKDDKSVKVYFKSTFRGVVDYIELVCSDEEIVLSDSNKIIEFTFREEKTILYFLCDGENTVIFVGNRPKEGDKVYNYVQKKGGYSSIYLYIFMYVNTIDLHKVFKEEDGWYSDYNRKIYAKKNNSDYVFATEETSFGTSVRTYNIEDLENLNTCMNIAINFYCGCREYYIDKYEHMIK